jgi:hypothetical protein
MTIRSVMSLCDYTDQAVISQVAGTALQHGPAALSDTPGTPTPCSCKDDELADPEIVGRNASGWSAGG